MPSELHIFDRRRNLQLQGFAGRGATTTLHDATETGVSISGTFQAAEDGAIRLDAAKYPSVSWHAMTFVTGAGDSHDVRLLDHATVVSGSETAATVLIDINGDENMDGGIDWLHLYFRDTRYTVTSTDCRRMYMVFAPRFENVDQDLQDGRFLTTGVDASDTTWTVDDTAKLAGGRYFIGTPNLEERIQPLSVVSGTQITVARGRRRETEGTFFSPTKNSTC